MGRTELPLVNEGDALFHVATFARLADVSDSLEISRARSKSSGDGLRAPSALPDAPAGASAVR
jgi:hypothetical protein